MSTQLIQPFWHPARVPILIDERVWSGGGDEPNHAKAPGVPVGGEHAAAVPLVPGGHEYRG